MKQSKTQDDFIVALKGIKAQLSDVFMKGENLEFLKQALDLHDEERENLFHSFEDEGCES